MKIRRLGIFPHMGKEKVCAALGDFLALCAEQGLEALLPSPLNNACGCAAYDAENRESLQTLDAAVSLGGDGTLLKMAHYLAPLDIPGFGINFGKLGFLAEIDFQGMRKAISKLAAGNYSIESRSLLQASLLTGETCRLAAHALNDLVLAKGDFSKLAHFQLFINGKLSGTYAADGIIVATATGSTGYALAAGGPLVQPALDLTVITPICAHSLTARTLVIPMTETLELKSMPGGEDMVLAADGENVAEVTADSCVRIGKSPYRMQFIRLTGRDYYQTWQQKLMRNI